MRLEGNGFVKCQGRPCYVHIHTYEVSTVLFDLMKVMSLLSSSIRKWVLIRYLTKNKASFIFTDKIDDAI